MSTPEFIDVELAKALNNPMRQAILRLLNAEGEQTSTSLAAHLGVTTGATSYNLRVLAAHGLVEEVSRKNSGKRRWWRAVPQDLRLPIPEERSGEVQKSARAATASWLDEDSAVFSKLFSGEGAELLAQLPFSRGTLVATPETMHAFFADYLALLNRYRAAQDPKEPGTVPMQLRFLAFPDAWVGLREPL